MKRWEIWIYAIMIAVLNLPLLSGAMFGSLIFEASAVADGQFWRIFTHPFVHVSWYHLLLDGAAFFILYTQLNEVSRVKRTVYVTACGLGSMVAAGLATPGLASMGYCGLSGIGHGLMAICGLEMVFGRKSDRSMKRVGMVSLVLVGTKCLVEAVTGKMAFEFMYFGLIGTPVAISHLGGLIGGSLAYGLATLLPRIRVEPLQSLTLNRP